MKQLYFYGKTDIGKKRQTNQDNFLTMRLADNVTLFVLCDGMGGTNGGNIASGLAVRTFAEYAEQKISEKTDMDSGICDTESINFGLLLTEAVSAANTAVYSRARENSELTNMGTTLVAAVVADKTVHIANIGDSRLYKLAGKEFIQLTHDHSYVQMLVDMGQITKEEAATNPRRNILTRAVGTEFSAEADIMSAELPLKGGYLLLCSDGLYNFLSEEEMVRIIHRKSKAYDADDYEAELAYKSNTLIDTANANGGGDNITIILIKIVYFQARVTMNSFDKYVGQVFDNRYKITKILGVGGMAVVFEAFDTKLNRIVALKMLKDEIANDSQSVKRFINESKAVSMLSHPNIVKIYDVSVKDNLKYIVMERINGITLKSYMSQKGALSLSETIGFTEQILRALEHAHSKGIIHRDIKPQNIMLLKNGRIKVTDFGIAKLPNAETVTMTDKAIGTVYYISPEQASGKLIDQRSDLYSLGVMMYEMVTGTLPFDAESPVSVALMQVNHIPKPPREVVPNIPRGVEQIIMLAMEKQPERRFQNAAQMLHHILQIKNNPTYVFKTKRTDGKVSLEDVEKSKGKKSSSKGGRSMFPVILGVTTAFLLVVAICSGVVIYRFTKSGEAKNSQTVEVPNLVDQVLTDDLREQLTDRGFKISVTYDDEATDIATNTVLSQSPDPGEKRVVIEGKQYCDINLTLSRGENSIVLPDMTVKDYRDVEVKLGELGLNYVEEYESNDNIPVDYVIRTSPMAGERVNAGQTITLYISQGSDVTYVQVPNFVGLSEEQAKAQLIEYDLGLGKITYQKSSKAKGTVISQSRNAYESVPAKSTSIDFVVSSGQD